MEWSEKWMRSEEMNITCEKIFNTFMNKNDREKEVMVESCCL